MNIETIQAALQTANLDGWLFYDFRGSDPLATSILDLPRGRFLSRRWFYFVPASGTPRKLVHAIESAALDTIPGTKLIYLPWPQLHQRLREMLTGAQRVAMQYSPDNAIPYVSRVDAGTVELVRSFGVEVVSSADLVQMFEATLSAAQWESHQDAGLRLGSAVLDAFTHLGELVRAGQRPTECEIQQFLLERFAREKLLCDHAPIVAVGPHSADPHYAPEPATASAIQPGDFVLIDAWVKRDHPGAIYADITWTGFLGQQMPEEIQKVFEIVRDARDAAVTAIQSAQAAGRPIQGRQADDACRKVIQDAGYGEFFIHRTGHSIHENTHGNGANLDNLETRDDRRLIPRTVFSVEPGIYLPGKFGVRSEINVYLPDAHTAIVTGIPAQREILRCG